VKRIAVDIFNDLDEILLDRGKFVKRSPICQECEAILIHLALSLFHFVFRNFLGMVDTEATIIRFTQIFRPEIQLAPEGIQSNFVQRKMALHFDEPKGQTIDISNKIQTSRRVPVKDTVNHFFQSLPSQIVVKFPNSKPLPGVCVIGTNNTRSPGMTGSTFIHPLRIQRRHDCCSTSGDVSEETAKDSFFFLSISMFSASADAKPGEQSLLPFLKAQVGTLDRNGRSD
jgi:hypothetical protein